MIKFVDANIFIERWFNPKAKDLIDNLGREEHCTSVLVLTEVHHKLTKKGITKTFEYIRAIMGAIKVYDITQTDFFNAMKDPLDMSINDKIHVAVMKRNGIDIIISFDEDFDRNNAIIREELS